MKKEPGFNGYKVMILKIIISCSLIDSQLPRIGTFILWKINLTIIIRQS